MCICSGQMDVLRGLSTTTTEVRHLTRNPLFEIEMYLKEKKI